MQLSGRIPSRLPSPVDGFVYVGAILLCSSTTSPATDLQFTDVESVPSGVHLIWNADPGQSYSMFTSSNFLDWMPTPVGATNEWVDTPPAGVWPKFYRVKENINPNPHNLDRKTNLCQHRRFKCGGRWKIPDGWLGRRVAYSSHPGSGSQSIWVRAPPGCCWNGMRASITTTLIQLPRPPLRRPITDRRSIMRFIRRRIRRPARMARGRWWPVLPTTPSAPGRTASISPA